MPDLMMHREPYVIGFFSFIVQKSIGGYQESIGPRSISRCPFAISCSNYALQAVHLHGPVVGIMYFIDRNLYRENPGTPYMYPLIETESRVLKLDDSYFLFGADVQSNPAD